MSIEQIKAEITQLLQSVQGDVSVCFKDCVSNDQFLFNELESYNTASLMKVVVGLVLLSCIENGELDENLKIELRNTFASKFDGSAFESDIEIDGEKQLYSKIGSTVSIMELLELMIVRSSNLATNNLFTLIDKRNLLSELLNKTGMTNTRIVRGVEDQKAFDAGIINQTNASDMLKLFEYINQGVIAGNKSATLMHGILTRQEHNSIIPLYLPENILIAHKTGTIRGVLHDAALISSGTDLCYILVIMSKNLTDVRKSSVDFAKVSKLFYDLALALNQEFCDQQSIAKEATNS